MDGATSPFECGNCGGDELLVPEYPSSDAVVRCADCDAVLTTWGALEPHVPGNAFKLVTDGPKSSIRLRRL